MTFSMIVILGVLMILGGLSLLSTPLINFISSGYYIVILFFILGIVGIVRGISEKRYDKHFIFSILSLILGIVGLVVPGAVAMNNFILLYLAAGWFLVHAIFTIIDAIAGRRNGGDTLTMVLGVALGVLELILAIYSIAHPAILAVSLGLLIGFYFIESGVSMIIIAKAACPGGNSLTILYTVMGLLTVIGGIAMFATPLLTFLGTGPCIIMLFFINGVVGVAHGIIEGRFDKFFFLSLLSLILGIIAVTVPGIAAMTDSILLYMAAGWFCIHGLFTIFNAIANRKKSDSALPMVLGIIVGVLGIILGIYSVAHPAVLAVGLGLLIGFYFIESGVNLILLGSAYSQAVAVARATK